MKKEKKHSILIVEDDQLLSLVQGRLVEQLGYHVAGKAATAEGAVEMARSLKPDLIMMDISLKGSMDGIEAMSKIRAFSDVPVIYLSGNSEKHSIERARKTNYVDYLIKPVTESDIAYPLRKGTGQLICTGPRGDEVSRAV